MRTAPAADLAGPSSSVSALPTRSRRGSPKLIILCWLMMGWSIQGQLTERFREGRETLSRMFFRRRRCGESYPGLTQATQRAGVDLFHRFWNRLRTSVPQRVGPAWTWYGWTVFAVDGSRIDAPRTRSNENALGKAARDKSHPQWWITRLIHLPTKMMWDWRQGPGTSSERAHLREMIPSLPQRSLPVGDTGFGGFDLLWQLSNGKVAFVIRCGGNSTLLVTHPRQRIERKGDVRYVYLWPKNRRRKKPLRLRLIVLKDHGRPVYLLTNVMEPTRLSRRVAGEFYRARWGIELDIGDVKQTLGLDHLRCKTPDMVRRELWVTLPAYNLVRKLIATAAAVHGKQPRRLGFTLACQTILSSWMLLATGTCRDVRQLWRLALQRIAAHEVANRPGRIEPRMLKRRRHRYPLMHDPRWKLRRALLSP